MLYTYIQHYMAKATSEIPFEIHEIKYSHFRRISIFLFIPRSIYSVYFCLYPSIPVLSCLNQAERYYLYQSISCHLSRPGTWEWRNILRTISLSIRNKTTFSWNETKFLRNEAKFHFNFCSSKRNETKFRIFLFCETSEIFAKQARLSYRFVFRKIK